MLEDFVSDISKDFSDNIIELLEYEQFINLKKENNIELTDDEKFFDTFIISPSKMTRFLLNRLEEKESE